MVLWSLTKQHQRLSSLIDQAHKFNADETELRAHWARYLCVLASGFLENALKDVYGNYAQRCSNKGVGNYVAATLGKIQNPKATRFVETARAFHDAWADGLNVFLDSEGRREAIDAIMSNRHLIAHGKDSGITLANLAEYLRRSVQVIEFIETQCGVHA